MQKVVSVNIGLSSGLTDGVREHEFPILSKYLKEGYKVINTISSSSNTTKSIINLTFILEKRTSSGVTYR